MLSAIVIALSVAAGPLSLQFDGSLKDGLSKIAETGNLNVIVVGDLSEPAQIRLSSVTADEALETVAKVYQLEVTKQGRMYVLRRANAPTVPAAPAPPEPSAALEAKIPAVPVEPTAIAASEEARPVKQLMKEIQKLEVEQERLEQETERLTEEAEQREELEADRTERLKELASATAEHQRAAERAKSEVILPGPTVVPSGETVKDAVSYGGPVVVESDARVKGRAVAFGGDVILKNRAVVHGDAVSFGGKIVREGNAKVHGEEVSIGTSGIFSSMAAHAVKASRVGDQSSDENEGGLGIARFLMEFVGLFAVGFLAMVLAPQRIKGLESAIREKPVVAGLLGLASALVAGPLTLVLVIIVVGFPLAIAMWVLGAIAILMGVAAIANLVGTLIPLGRVRRTQAMVLALGLFLMLLLAHIPGIGPVAVTLAAFVSLGAAILSRLGAPIQKGLPIVESERIPA